MPEDASLDSFAPATEDDETETDAPETTPDADPAVSTYAWSPGGGNCSECGESVEKQWRAGGQRDGDLVCADCKEW
ncbi:DUF7573 domain-containing protein [Halorussus amylolyticus]|uniref:DUF7573 domain-containing protein n=1 Tax=Halorussus amylolyticus TaxID=1126242 RepID=UPI001052DDA9|nr:hypothetical protein [Halorussus amylolyticus]